jgi:hypothetical protein
MYLDSMETSEYYSVWWWRYDKSVFRYDKAGTNTSMTYYLFPGNATTPYIHVDYMTDTLGRIDTAIVSYWDGASFYPGEIWDYTYTASGMLRMQYIEYLDSLGKHPYKSYTNDYDQDDLIVVSTECRYMNGQWETYIITDYVYDDNKYLVEVRSYFVDGPDLHKRSKIEYMNLPNGLPWKTWEYSWNNSSQQWVWIQTTWFYYDSLNHLESYLISTMGSGAYRATIVNDKTYAFDDLVLPWDMESRTDHFSYMMTEFNVETEDFGGWQPYSKTVFYYSRHHDAPLPVDTPEISVRIYPNPVKYRLWVELNDIEGPVQFQVTDMLGKQVLSWEMEESALVPVSGLSQGLYLYRVLKGAETIGKGRFIRVD